MDYDDPIGTEQRKPDWPLVIYLVFAPGIIFGLGVLFGWYISS